MELSNCLLVLLVGFACLRTTASDIPLSTTDSVKNEALPKITTTTKATSQTITSSTPQSISSKATSALPTTTPTTTVSSSTATKTTTTTSTTPKPTEVPVDKTTTQASAISSSTLSTTTSSPSTTTRRHIGKKELDEEFDSSYSSTTPPELSTSSSISPSIDSAVNHQYVEELQPINDVVVIQKEAPPSSRSSLYAGLIFGSILSMALGFLIYKRIDSARRRREYRRMNDYLIDGMYNDI